MKAIILFSLTLVLVSTKSISHTNKTIQLEEIHKELSKKDPQIFTHQFVPDVIHYEKCMEEDFCKAGKIISNTLGRNVIISRLFRTYTEGKNCTIIDSGKELQMKELLKRMSRCVQKKYSKMQSASGH